MINSASSCGAVAESIPLAFHPAAACSIPTEEAVKPVVQAMAINNVQIGCVPRIFICFGISFAEPTFFPTTVFPLLSHSSCAAVQGMSSAPDLAAIQQARAQLSFTPAHAGTDAFVRPPAERYRAAASFDALPFCMI